MSDYLHFRDALTQAHDDEVTDALAWALSIADACRAELKARADATTGHTGVTYRLTAVEMVSLPENYIQDQVVPELMDAALADGADRRSLFAHVEEDLKDGCWVIRATGLVRRLPPEPLDPDF